MPKVNILTAQSGEWEGLFVDGKLIDEAHTLGEGNSKLYLLEKSEELNFSLEDISECELNDEDEEELMDSGSFPLNMSELKGNYE